MHRPLICLGFSVAIVGASSAVAASATLVGLDDFVLVDDVTGVTVQDAWARATPGSAGTATVSVTLMGGAQADALSGASSPLAKSADVHESSSDHGVMKMRPVSGGVEIKPGQTVEFKPGGYHLMFVGISQPVEQGKRVKGTLEFEKAGKVDVEYAIEPIGGTPKGEDAGHGGMHMNH